MASAESDDISQLVDNDELENNNRSRFGRASTHKEETGNSVSLGQINAALEESEETESKVNISDNLRARDTKGGGEVNAHNVCNDQNTTTGDVTVASPPVYYSTHSGESTVVQEPIVIRQPNGVHVIRTQQCCELAPHRHRAERPLKIKHIKLLQAFSIVSIFIFFPLGIPAMHYAYKSEKEFNEGIMRGDIDKARKLVKRTERLIIFSVLGCLLVGVAVFAIVERHLMADDEEYWQHRANTGIVPAAG